MKNLNHVCLSLVCFVIIGPLAFQVRADQPNIIVILSDDMGFSDLGCYGGEIDTPNLDSLARGGLRFTEFYATARCWPTRATLMSGRYANSLGPRQVAIPQLLKQVGYQTGMVGKWHLSTDPKKNAPPQRSFDDFFGTLIGAGSFWNPDSLTRGTEAITVDDDFYYTDKIGEEAVRQIENFSGKGTPFFQYLAFTAPHWPLHAPEETIQKYIERYRGGWEKLRADRYARMLEMGIITKERWPLPEREKRVQDWDTIEHKQWRIRNMAVYAAMIDHMDQAIGRVLSALKENYQFKNTLIIFTNDNGACPEHLKGDGWGTAKNVLREAKAKGENVSVGDNFDTPSGGPLTYHSVGHNWANAQNTPMRRYKSNVHEGGACVPCIIHWPARLKGAGTITNQRGHVVDILATCLDVAGGDYPEILDGAPLDPNEGTSLLPAITGGNQDPQRTYYFNHSGTHAVIRGEWKLIREWKSEWHLYNLHREKTEITDVADSHPELVNELTALWMARFSPAQKK